MSLRLSKPILCLITRGASTESTTTADPQFANILQQISAAVDAGIDFIQLREKQLTTRVLFELTEQAVTLTRRGKTKVLVNDRADVAAGAGADGVHLTAHSIDTTTIRRAFGPEFLIGRSTHAVSEVMAARDEGANLVVFGPVFATPSKQAYGPPLGVGELTAAARAVAEFPVLALGGISLENAKDCIDAGAAGIAGISLFKEPAELRRVTENIKSLGKKVS